MRPPYLRGPPCQRHNRRPEERPEPAEREVADRILVACRYLCSFGSSRISFGDVAPTRCQLLNFQPRPSYWLPGLPYQNLPGGLGVDRRDEVAEQGNAGRVDFVTREHADAYDAEQEGDE